MSVDITIQETVNEVDITVNQNVITVNVTRTTGGGGVESINGETGVVVLTTDNVNEGLINLYFTAARVRATVLTGISFVSGIAITATDTILSAFGKLQKQISSLGAVAFSNNYNDLDNKPTIPSPQNLTEVITVGDLSSWFEPFPSFPANSFTTIALGRELTDNYYDTQNVGTGGLFLDKDIVFPDNATIRFQAGYVEDNVTPTNVTLLPYRFTTDAYVFYQGAIVTDITLQPEDVCTLKWGGYNSTDSIQIWFLTVVSKSSGGSVTPSTLISTDADNALTVGTDSKLFVPESTGTVTNVSGTTDEITVSNSATTPVVGISSAYTSARDAYADAKVADNLTASTTVAPSKTAVNTALDLKAPIAEPTFSGLVTSVGTTQTGSSATGVLNLSQTWNTTGNPTALKLNVTNTASSASSLLFDFQVNGVSMGRLTKTGILTVGNGINVGSGAVQGSFFGTSGNVFNFGNNYMYGASGPATAATSGSKSVFLTDISWSPTSGTSDLNIFNASPTINQTGGANGKVRGFYFNPTLTAAADAIAIDVQKGRLLFSATNTASGTTGNQTINKISGTVNFAAGASSLVVTNNLVTANSIVIPCVYGADATANTARITPTSGSFTINLNAAATAETTVAFFVIN